MIHEYNIEGTPEVYTIAVNSCSNSGDWDFALSVYSDMTKKGLLPDEVFAFWCYFEYYACDLFLNGGFSVNLRNDNLRKQHYNLRLFSLDYMA